MKRNLAGKGGVLEVGRISGGGWSEGEVLEGWMV